LGCARTSNLFSSTVAGKKGKYELKQYNRTMITFHSACICLHFPRHNLLKYRK
jgi:hypothetical protein